MLLVIDEADPGAVPGASTMFFGECTLNYGGEIGSTCIERLSVRSGWFHRYLGRLNISANNNTYASNDNYKLAPAVTAAAA